MNELVTFNKAKKQIVVSSRQVAEHFEKRHDHVLRDIEVIAESINSNYETPNLGFHEMFFKTTYKVPGNKKSYPEYLINRDGFALLVMGFTGAKAMEWKLKYIDAFNAMEAELNKKRLRPRSVSSVMRDIEATMRVMLKANPAIPRGIALASAFDQVEVTRDMYLPIIKEVLIPPATTEEASCKLKPTDIAVKCNLLGKNGSPSAKVANIALQTLGLQERDGKSNWTLTAKGQEYGAMFPYSKNAHSGYEIRWKETVLELIGGNEDEQD